MKEDKDDQHVVTAEEPPTEDELPIPEEVHKRAKALARALFELDES